ncbi:MAG TPA: FecR family protein [Armatimonadota bacterium]|jgi:ferric-dicitrate binding protein FerR (iron transport regulator)
MACNQETLILLSRYANDETTAEEAARATAHVGSCTACRDLLEDWRSQRQLLIWASTLELPELSAITLREIAQREEPMSVPLRASRRFAWPHMRINRAFSFATVATAVTLGLMYTYASRNALFTPRLPDGTTLGSAAPVVRVHNGIVLELAPNTRVTRLGDDRIRLDAGWLRATVRHGSGLRIQTKRLDVRDVGTVFQMNAGAPSDSVTVEEGEVSVSRGGKTYQVRHEQILSVSDKGQPDWGALPAYKPEEGEPGQPLVNSHDAFVPTDEQSLDWREGLQRLATVLPDARSSGTSGASSTWPGVDSVFRLSQSFAQGARRGMRAHFAEIARAQSGDTGNIGTWEFPVAYVMVDNVADPRGLAPDTYQIGMFANGSRLFWRFRGSRGTVLDTPLSFERQPISRTGGICSGNGSSSAGNWEFNMVREQGQATSTAYLRFMDWPGAMKPTLRLELKPLDGYHREARTMQADLIRRTAGVTGLALERGNADLLYLDPGRSHRLMIAWNANAGSQANAVMERAGKGRGDSALMGVLFTDSPLILPHLPAGTYLLKWIAPSSGGASRWEIGTLNGRAAMALPSNADHWKGLDAHRITATSDQPLSGSGVSRPLAVEIGTGAASGGAYPFRFTLRNNSTDIRALGSGWVQVKQP